MKAFVICRDRVTYARQCIDALLQTPGIDRVVLVDHGSTWEPMRRWLAGPDRLSAFGYVTVYYQENMHPRDLWRPGGPIYHNTATDDERFIVTDCDVIPDRTCPADWVDRLGDVLDRYPAVRKAGLGLRTDDLPARYAHRDTVQAWEVQYQAALDGGRLSTMETHRGAVIADIDTTLAMYRRFEPFTLGPAVRLRPPYVARHLPWYEDTTNLDEEQRYYRDHAAYGHWRDPGGYADDYKLRETQ